jgi:hypothetical protein
MDQSTTPGARSNVFAIVVAILLLFTFAAGAHDHGQFANSGIDKSWWNGLKSGRGLCCSFADGVSLKSVDWDTLNGQYRVRLCAEPPDSYEEWATCENKKFVIVPDEALVLVPNKYGDAVVWPYIISGEVAVRCFMPGSGT